MHDKLETIWLFSRALPVPRPCRNVRWKWRGLKQYRDTVTSTCMDSVNHFYHESPLENKPFSRKNSYSGSSRARNGQGDWKTGWQQNIDAIPGIRMCGTSCFLMKSNIPSAPYAILNGGKDWKKTMITKFQQSYQIPSIVTSFFRHLSFSLWAFVECRATVEGWLLALLGCNQ